MENGWKMENGKWKTDLITALGPSKRSLGCRVGPWRESGFE
jgi:hypothetical protein